MKSGVEPGSTSGATSITPDRCDLRARRGGQGTEIHVALTYRPPGGMMGGAVAKLFSRAPVQQIQVELRRIKQTMEKPARCRRHAGGRKAQAMNDER
jgi:uncharacterized membrane protein